MSATPPTEAELAEWEDYIRNQCGCGTVPEFNPEDKKFPFCESWGCLEVYRLIAAYRDIRFQLARKAVSALPMAGVDVTQYIDKLEVENKALREAVNVGNGAIGLLQDVIRFQGDDKAMGVITRQARVLLTPASQPESEQPAEGESAENYKPQEATP